MWAVPKYASDFEYPSKKRVRLNPLGEDVHLHQDGSVTRDEDSIIRIQRIWKEKLYAPGGTIYNKFIVKYKDGFD